MTLRGRLGLQTPGYDRKYPEGHFMPKDYCYLEVLCRLELGLI